jgi:hypothetical protein
MLVKNALKANGFSEVSGNGIRALDQAEHTSKAQSV